MTEEPVVTVVMIDGEARTVRARLVDVVDHHSGDVVYVKRVPILDGMSLSEVTHADSEVPEYVTVFHG
jgi:hypothetical protein